MRIRTIKPEWLEDERLQMCSSDARVLSIALILMADDYGRGRLSPAVKATVFPAKPRAFEAAFDELRPWFAAPYVVRGQSYYEVLNWSKHQRVDKPGKPRIPGPLANIPETLANIPETLAPDLDPDHDQDHDLNTQSAKSRPLVDVQLGQRQKHKNVKEVFDHWVSHHISPSRQHSAVLNLKRQNLIRARLREGYSIERLKAAIEGVKHSGYHMGDNERGRKYNQLETILRDGSQVEKFEDYQPETPSDRKREEIESERARERVLARARKERGGSWN